MTQEMGKTHILWGKGFHPTWVTFMKAHLGDYQTVIISDRLFGNMKAVADLASKNDGEVGGFLIKTGVGVTKVSIGVRLVNLIVGNDRAITLEPQETLEPGEEYIGTFHSHPVTDVPSVHDVITFLADPMEKVSIVRGVDGTINLKVKKPDTRPLDPKLIETLKEKYPKGDTGMAALVRDFNFMFFQGKDDTLTRSYETESAPNGTISLDELALGVEGSPHFPESTKKKPKKGLAEGEEAKAYKWSKLGDDYTFDRITKKWVRK